MFNWWPLMWKKTHREKMKFCEATTNPTLTGWSNIVFGSNLILDDMQAVQDCDAVLKAAKIRAIKSQGIIIRDKKPRSGKRITSGSKKRRR